MKVSCSVSRIVGGLLICRSIAMATAGGALPKQQELTALDAAAGDWFGFSVATDGHYIVVGARNDDSGKGSAYLFEWNESTETWDPVIKLSAPDGQANDWFGQAVAVSGDTVAVGADGRSSEAGAVYLFKRDFGGTDHWGQLPLLTPSDGAAGDRFGNSLDFSGEVLAVGSPYGGACAGPWGAYGAAYLFGRDVGGADSWGLIKEVLDPSPSNCETMGIVAIDGDTLAVGAFSANDTCPLIDSECRSGAVVIFQQDEGGLGNWGKVSRLVVPSGGDTNEYFGASLDLSGDDLIVGAFVADPPTNVGAAFIYSRNQGGANAWGYVASPTSAVANEQNWFGEGVGISGDHAVVGERFGDDPVTDAGSAYLYARDQGGASTWGRRYLLEKDSPEETDFFGAAVAISGDIIVVGARQDNGACPSNPDCGSGSATVFTLDIFSDGFENGDWSRWSWSAS